MKWFSEEVRYLSFNTEMHRPERAPHGMDLQRGCAARIWSTNDLFLHMQMTGKGGRSGGEWDVIVRDSDWHVARRHWSVSWRTWRLTTLRVSEPGTLPVSGVGGLLTSLWMCVSRPSGLKPLLNTHPRNDTDTLPSGPPPSPDRVPGKQDLYLLTPPLRIPPNLLLLPLSLSESITRWLSYNHSH